MRGRELRIWPLVSNLAIHGLHKYTCVPHSNVRWDYKLQCSIKGISYMYIGHMTHTVIIVGHKVYKCKAQPISIPSVTFSWLDTHSLRTCTLVVIVWWHWGAMQILWMLWGSCHSPIPSAPAQQTRPSPSGMPELWDCVCMCKGWLLCSYNSN